MGVGSDHVVVFSVEKVAIVACHVFFEDDDGGWERFKGLAASNEEFDEVVVWEIAYDPLNPSTVVIRWVRGK